MKRHASIVTSLFIVCCAVLCLCSCGKKQNKRTVSQDTLRLMQKTQAELAACVERCRSAAQESKDKEILLALANSQQVLVDRHETIINILLKKYKWDRVSTVSFPIEMNPRTIVLAPVDEYREILANAPGVQLRDDPENKIYPMPMEATGMYDVLVGRIRQDISRDDKRGLDIFISGDQLLKGAALNAVQIAEVLVNGK